MAFRASNIVIAVLLFLLSFFIISPVEIFAQRGCCSWHGGVDYCDTSTGRQVCNDGTYSPSCTCAYVPPAPVIETSYKTKTVSISFKTKKVNDSTLLEGKTKVVQQGVKGKKEVTYLVTYTDGVETSREKLYETVVKDPVNEIIAVGTEKKEPTPVSETKSQPETTSGNADNSDGNVAGATDEIEEPLTATEWIFAILFLFGIIAMPVLAVKKVVGVIKSRKPHN